MRRIFLLLSLVFVVGGGFAFAAAQTTTEPKTEETDSGAETVECATPVGSPDAEAIADMLATAVATPEVAEDLATAVASPGASPVAAENPCATPVSGTPAS